MYLLQRNLLKEIQDLEIIEQKTRKRLVDAPCGGLRIIKKRDKPEFYYVDPNIKNNPNGKYMKKSEFELVKRLAQRDYDKKILDKTEKRIKAIKKFLLQYEKTDLKQVYENTSKLRQEIIDASVLSDKEYVKRWLEVPYEGKVIPENVGEIYTERGEQVRSKSEKIIADKLYMLGVPYKYEHPLYLDRNITVYPDFTILQVEKKQEIYLEHFGRMDDIDYVEKVMYKIQTYENNGIYLGVNLFFTFETSKKPLNIKKLDEFIKRIIV